MKFIYQLAFFGAIASASPVVVPPTSLGLQARNQPQAFISTVAGPEDIHTDDSNCKCKRCSPAELQGLVSMGSNLLGGLTKTVGGGSLSESTNSNTGLSTNNVSNQNTLSNNVNNLNTLSNNINNLNSATNNINNLNSVSNNVNDQNSVTNSNTSTNGVTGGTTTTTSSSGCGGPGQPACPPGQPTPASSGSLSLLTQTTTSNGRFTLPDGRQCCACPA